MKKGILLLSILMGILIISGIVYFGFIKIPQAITTVGSSTLGIQKVEYFKSSSSCFDSSSQSLWIYTFRGGGLGQWAVGSVNPADVPDYYSGKEIPVNSFSLDTKYTQSCIYSIVNDISVTPIYKLTTPQEWTCLDFSSDKAIEKCALMLKQGGYIVIQVPQIDSFIAEKHKESWQAMGLDHVNYFSKKTITQFLGNKGFKVVKIKSSIEVKLFLMYSIFDKKRKKQGTAKATQAERQEYFNKKVNRSKWQLRFVVWAHNILYNILSILNIGDEMIIIARKV